MPEVKLVPLKKELSMDLGDLGGLAKVLEMMDGISSDDIVLDHLISVFMAEEPEEESKEELIKRVILSSLKAIEVNIAIMGDKVCERAEEN